MFEVVRITLSLSIHPFSKRQGAGDSVFLKIPPDHSRAQGSSALGTSGDGVLTNFEREGSAERQHIGRNDKNTCGTRDMYVLEPRKALDESL